MVTLCLSSPIHMASNPTRGPTSSVLEEIVLAWFESRSAGRPFVWHLDSAPCHTREVSVKCKNISATTSSLTSGRLIPQIAIFLILYGIQLSKRPTEHQRRTESKNNGSIYQFQLENHQKNLQEILKSSRGHG